MFRKTYSEKKLEMPKIAGFDIETKGLGGEYIAGAIWTHDDIRMHFDNLHSLFEFIIDNPKYRYIAHNASGYEFAYLYPMVYDFFNHNPDCELYPIIQGDSRVIGLIISIKDTGKKTRRGKFKQTRIELHDSLCLFNMSLEKVAQAYCPEFPKLKGNINFEKEDFDPTNKEHMDYLYRDCLIIVKAYERHFNNVKEAFGVPLGITAGSTALRAFKATIPEGHAYYRINENADKFIRLAYYGGLVFPGHSTGDWGSVGCVDVNGAYAYQMKKHKFPVGSAKATHLYDNTKIGFYECDCYVPPSVFDTIGFNPLPLRTDKGLVWPTGSFTTFVSTPEIEYARKCGCKVTVICGYEFDKCEDIFSDLVDICQKMEVKDNFRYKPSIKSIRNNGYGKFGAKQEHTTVKFSREIMEGYKPLIIEETGKIIPGIYIGQEKQEADYMMPHWACLITAYERLFIMHHIEEAFRRGAKNVYADTDSIKCDLNVLLSMIEDGFIDVGDNYGQFKVEEICSEFILLGPKCFYGTPENSKVKPLIKAKGVPNSVLDKKVYYEAVEALSRPLPKKTKKGSKQEEHRELKFTSVKSVMKIIKENSHVSPVPRKRKITDIRNSSSWKYDSGKIYPRGYVCT